MDRIPRLTRRRMFQLAAAGAAGASASGWIETLAAMAGPRPATSCILLWMPGGPSQLDTFDPKPGHENGGPFQAIETATPGMHIAEHLPKLACATSDLAIIRSMSTKEGDHGRATYLLRTGYLPQGPVRYPALGSLIANERDDESADLPPFVCIGPVRGFNPAAYSSGFLGPRCAPLIVGERPLGSGGVDSDEPSLKVDDLDPPAGITRARADDRLELMHSLSASFQATRPGIPALSHQDAYRRAVRLMRSPAARAFDLEDEPAALRDAYGRNPFGQGCLLARRLVERGVPFVEVSLSGVDGVTVGWDTHQDNFAAVERLSAALDAGWSTLMSDLRSRGYLESTLIVWMGEFGRTPKINEQAGRDHFPNAWTTVLAGGGIRGGQVIGHTSDDGMEVTDRPVEVPDLMATIIKALGLDPMRQNLAENDRPIRLVDPKARPIAELLA